jgi:hypothetical protein
VQFTIGQDTHEKLRRVQALLRREIPDGDPGTIFDRALTLLLEKVEKTKLGAAVRPRPCPPIRPGTDSSVRSREVPRAVKRVAWKSDGGQCAFVSPTGRRCSERTFLEFHQPPVGLLENIKNLTRIEHVGPLRKSSGVAGHTPGGAAGH